MEPMQVPLNKVLNFSPARLRKRDVEGRAIGGTLKTR